MRSASSALRLLALIAVALVTPASLFAQGAPISGTAKLALNASDTTPTVGTTVDLTLIVDLTGVTGKNSSGSTVPVVLGGYQINVTFDASKLRLDTVSGGTSSGYTSAPTFTDPSSANAQGKVTLAASQTSSSSPTGSVNVAKLRFTTLTVSTVTATATATSIASAYQPPSAGPASVPSTSGSRTLTIEAVPPPQPPAVPNTPSPSNNATNVAAPVRLTWRASDADSHDVYFGTSATPPLLKTTSSASTTVTTAGSTKYYWKIVAKNEAGSTTGPVWNFTTAAVTVCNEPTQPVITAPATVEAGAEFILSWTGSENATEYRLEESTSETFTSPTVYTLASDAYTKSLSKSVSQPTTFYFRVRGNNSASPCSVTGAWSPTVAVLVQPAPGWGIVPVVLSKAGAFGAYFKSSLQLHNPTTSAITGMLQFHQEGYVGLESDPQLPYTIEAGQTISYDDVVLQLGAAGKNGSLDIRSTSGPLPVAVTRTFNDAGVNGTSGMTEVMVEPQDTLANGDAAVLVVAPDLSRSRFSVGVRTLDAPATIEVTVRRPTGEVLGTVTKAYAQMYFIARSVGEFTGMALTGNETLDIRVTSGRIIVYGSSADNVTNDPSLQYATRY